jgi:hypothetical protein
MDRPQQASGVALPGLEGPQIKGLNHRCGDRRDLGLVVGSQVIT